MSQWLAVASGAALGALLRWGAGLWLNGMWTGFALGTLAVNAAGGFLAGVALAVFSDWPAETVRLFVVTGFLGGLTTFSSFSAEQLVLLQRGQWLTAGAHTAAHVLGSLACTGLGFTLARSLLR